MRKIYMSSSYAMDREKIKGKTEEQVAKEALGEVLKHMGLSLQFQADRGEVEMPQIIRVEVVKELLDIHVRLHCEEERDGGDVVSPVVPRKESLCS